MRTRIPRYIDDPPQVFWWEADEVAAFSGAFVLGALAGHGLAGLVAGVALSWLLARLKAGGGSSRLPRLAYWYGFSSLRPESRRRRFFE